MRFRLDRSFAMLRPVTAGTFVAAVHWLLDPGHWLAERTTPYTFRFDHYGHCTSRTELELAAISAPVIDHPPARSCNTISAFSSVAWTAWTFTIA